MSSQSITISSSSLLGEKGVYFTAYQLAGGGFIATWEEQKNDTSSIVYQRFDDDAQAVDNRVIVADDWDTHVPTVAELENGNIVVAWQESSNGYREIQYRVFDSSDAIIKSGVASQKSDDDYINVKVLDLGQNKFIIDAEINDDFPGQPSYGRTLREFNYAGEPLANEVEYISLAGSTMTSDPIALSTETVGSLFFSSDNNTLLFTSHDLSSGSLSTPITVATQVDDGIPVELIGDANELYVSYSSGGKNYVAKLNADGTLAVPAVQVDENAVSVQLVKMDSDHLAVVSSTGDLTGTSDVNILSTSDLSTISSLTNVDTGGSNASSNIIFGSNEKLHIAAYNNGDHKITTLSLTGFVNQAPTISTTTSLTTNEDTFTGQIPLAITDKDGDATSYTIGSATLGTVTDNGNGTFTYTPDTNANGSDSFTITASDGTSSASETVNITITPVNDAPIIDTTFKINTVEGRASSAITFSATDVENDAVSFTFGTPSKGTVVDNNDGTFTYTGSGNNNGDDSFTITANDGTDTSTRTVSVIIQALTGTAESDTLTGTDQNDTIQGYAGDDIINAGAGDDIIYGGAGDDIINAGDGDDSIIVDHDDLSYSSTFGYEVGGFTFRDRTSSVLSVDGIDGGSGADIVLIQPSDNVHDTVFLNSASFVNVEKARIELVQGVGQFDAAFVSGSLYEQTPSWYFDVGTVEVFSDDENLHFDLSKISSDFHQNDYLYLNGQFNSIDMSNASTNPRIQLSRNPINDIIGNDYDNSIFYGDYKKFGANPQINQSFDISLMHGSDKFYLDTNGEENFIELNGEWDGGAGIDYLNFSSSSSQLIDISNVNLQGWEYFDGGNATIIAAENQLTNLTSVSGNVFEINPEGYIELTSNADTFVGSGLETVKGAEGDDTISNSFAVFFEGNQQDFTVTRDPTNSASFYVEHSGGDKSQGTDYLTNVMELKFSDNSTLKLDDFPNLITSNLTLLTYSETLYGQYEYAPTQAGSDIEYFQIYSAPSSPFRFNFSSTQLKSLQAKFSFYDETEQRLDIQSEYSNYYPNKIAKLGKDTAEGFVEHMGGIVTVRMESYDFLWHDDQITAQYVIGYELLDDKTNSESTAGAIDPSSGEAFGYIGTLEDRDWIATDLAAGSTYLIQVQGKSSGNGTLLDPALKIYHESDLVNAIDTTTVAGAAGGDEYEQFVAVGGKYYIEVSDASGLYTGSYKVVQRSKDIQSADIQTTGRLDFDNLGVAKVYGEINELADRDWFRVELKKGFSYKIEGVGSSTNEGTLQNPFIEVRSALGTLLSSASDGGTGNNAQLYFQAPEDGYYYVGAAASGNAGKGTYELRVAGIPDDYVGNASTTKVIAIDETIHGLVHLAQDTDWFKVGLSAETTYEISVVGDKSSNAELDPLRDPFLTIRDANGDIIVSNDDWNGTFDAKLFFTPDTTGHYFFETGSAFRYDTGAYAISLKFAESDDFGNSISDTNLSAGILSSDGLTTGEIQVPGDVDYFKVEVEAGKNYQLDVQGLGGNAGTLADPALRIFSSDGALIEYADDGGSGSDTLTYFSPSESGSYFLEVSSDDGSSQGSYQVKIKESALPADDVGNTHDTSKLISIGEEFNGNLLTRADEDWFAVDLIAGKRYTAIASGEGSGGGNLADPFLELRTSTGALIDTDDDGSWLDDAAISFVPDTSGRYIFVVKTQLTDETGSYRFVVRDPDDHGSTIGNATEITLDQTYEGALQWADGRYGAKAVNSDAIPVDRDEDWFKLSVTQGEVVTIEVTPTASNGLSRALVEIIDPSGVVPVARGDGKEVNDGTASATFKATTTGVYSIRVTDGAGSTGGYTVKAISGDTSDEDLTLPVNLTFASGEALSVAKIGVAGDTDTFEISLISDASYKIEVVNVRDGLITPIEDAELSLAFTANGSSSESDVIVYSGDTPDRMASSSYTPISDGVLRISVSAADNLDTGQYALRVLDLSVSGGDQLPDTITDFDTNSDLILTIGDTYSGVIESSSDVDLIGVNLTSAQRNILSVKGYDAGEGTMAAPQLTLLSQTGAVVARSGLVQDGVASVDLTVFESGLYFLRVDNAGIEGNIGTYLIENKTVETNSKSDDISDNFTTTHTVAPGSSINTAIDFDGDIDLVSFTVEANTSYVLDALGAGANSGSLANSHLIVYDASGVQITKDTDSGANADARVTLIGGASDQTYYASVSGEDGETGSYVLRLRKMYNGEFDPLAPEQWYRNSLNIDKLNGEYSGAGITVGIVDDGIDYVHPDLVNQVDLSIDYDAEFGTDNGIYKYTPLGGKPIDNHGTPVAGIIVAEANNETGIAGLAPDADAASFRVKWAASHISKAMSLQNQVDVSNNSWGYIDPFSDDFSSASLMVDYASIRYAVETGRGGLGTNFVFSAGNSRSEGDNVNHHNFQNARETITVAAIDPDDTVSGFSTPGAAILIGAYGNDIMTTDRLGGVGNPGDYNGGFNGTSAAAPQVSAIVALMLEANPNLGYRDVQSILAHSTRHPDSASWKQNSASNHNLGGHYFNDDMGFGIVDGFAAVRLAETWQSAQTAQNEQYAGARKFDINTTITDNDEESGLSYEFEINSNLLVEHAELGIDIRHERLGDLTIELISPTGTVSRLLDRPTATEGRPYGLFGEYAPLPKHLIFDLTSAQFRGEEASGTWTVRVKDVRAEVTGTLYSLSLRLYGEENTGDDQYIFTEEFASAVNAPALRDDGGIDWINAACVSTNSTVNLATKSFIIANRHGSIEEWVEIENVATGDGDDSLVGSDITNTLIAGRGDDNITPGYGNNVVDGGQGFDTVTFTGKYEDHQISYNSSTKKLSVIHSRNNGGNLQTDTHILTNVELLKFDDLNVSLETEIGNSAPQVSKAILAGPLTVENDSDFSILVPEDAFSDTDQTGGFELSAELANGVSLPEWMSFDPATGKLVGVPPEGVQGRYTVLVKARDDFGAETFQELTINVGDNLAPIVDAEKLIEPDEDTTSVALNITSPADPEGSSITITVTEVPIGGEIKKGSGELVAVNDTLSTDEIRDLVFIPTENFVGNAGALSYEVVDAEGVSASTAINILLKAVNDAPEFQINNFIPIQYEGTEKTINLNVPLPTDQEETITEITVVEVPVYGEVKLNGNLVKVGDKIATSSLSSLEYTIDQYINGTVGKFTIRATDSEGANADWNVKLQVNGEAGLVSGSSGPDELFGSLDSDRIFGLSGDDIISSNDGNDTVYGGSGADIIFAGNGNDIINGGSGDDYISGDVGADTMFGGPGDDTFVVDNAQDKPTEVLSRGAGGKDTIQTNITFSTPQNIENITALGSNSINLSGNSLDNIIEGNKGGNILSGLEGSDILIGLDGDDTLDGGSGRDQMSGGKGDDFYIVDSRSDVLYEQADEGFDTVSSSATFVLGANIEKLVLTGTSNIAAGGNSLNNVIIGNAGHNYINGGLGADDMQGGDGDDTYVVDTARDIISDTSGTDTVRASIDYTLPDEIENLELIGLLDLEAYGNSSDNQITGNSGNNIINGFSGSDVLIGRGGEDAFYINKEAAGVDVIKDFESGKDLLLLDAIGFDLFDTQSLTGHSGQVQVTDFEVVDTLSDRGTTLFSLNKETSTLSVYSAKENQDLAIVSFDMTLSDEILASDIYVLL